MCAQWLLESREHHDNGVGDVAERSLWGPQQCWSLTEKQGPCSHRTAGSDAWELGLRVERRVAQEPLRPTGAMEF